MADVDLGTIKARLDIDTALVNQRVDEVLDAWKSIQTGTGSITSNMTRKMVEGVTQYQQKLDILAAKLEKQRQLITQLESTANKPVTGQNSQAEIAKATAQLDKEKIKLKELEAQFDRTYAAQQNFILQQDKTAKKAEEVTVKLDNKKAGANFKVGTDLAASGLRTLNQVAPGTIGSIDAIITQVNAAREAMSNASSTPMKWAMGLSAAVGVATTLVVAGIQQMKKAEEERRQAYEEGVEKTKEYAEQLISLETNIRVMQDEKSTVDEVRSAREALTNTFPELITSYDTEGNAILANNDHLKEQLDLLKTKQELARMEIADNGGDVLGDAQNKKDEIRKAEGDLHLYNTQLEKAIANGGIFNSINGSYTTDALTKSIADTEEHLKKLQLEYKGAMLNVEEYYKAQLQGAVKIADANGELTLGWQDMSKAQEMALNAYAGNMENLDRYISGGTDAFNAAVQDLQNILNNPDMLAPYIDQLNNANAEAEKQSRLTAILFDNYDQQTASAEALGEAYTVLTSGGELADDVMRALISTLPTLKQYLEETGDLTLDAGRALAQALGQVDYSEQLNQLSELSSAYQTLADGQQLSVKQLYDLAAAYPEVADYIAQTNDLTLNEGQILQQVFEIKRQEYIASLQQNREVAESAKQRAQAVVDSLSAEITALEAAIELKGRTGNNDVLPSLGTVSLKNQLAEAEKELEKYQQNIDAANAKIAAAQSKAANISSFSGSSSKSSSKKSSSSSKSNRNEALAAELKQLDQKKKMDQLTSQEEIAWLERIQRKYKMNTDEKYDLEYRLYSAKKKYEQELEQAATERLNAEYKAIENKKALGELSAKEELAWLERIQQTFRMNAEEQMKLEIKLYNLKKQLHEEDVAALDKIGDVVTEALKNKYEEQKKAEQDRINESIQSWQDWEDETCEAIQGQIDALDELEKQQESEEKRAEYEKKRQATELLLRYEKDEYQRKQLEKQLAQLDAEEQKRLDEEAREAERERLEQEMEEAKETSQKQQEALEKELEELDKVYDELTKDFALRAEAEKAIMNSTQKEIIELIKSYAPEYDLAGQSIGEKLAEGFKAKAGSIVEYLDNLVKKVQEYQANMAYTANQAADKFWADRKKYEQQIAASAAPPVVKTSSPTVNMTVQINQPVQSPIEMRRQLERVADQIGRQLGG